jgi:membrane protein implicated in regulation of membrane protease activity
VAIVWIAVGVVLLAIELQHLALYALFVAVGCFGAAIVAVAAPDALVAQVLTAVIVSIAGIALVRPRFSSRVHARGPGHGGRGVHGGFIGHEVVTLDVVGGPDRAGHVELAGERWLAASGGDVTLPAGTRVMITGVEGTTLIVWPLAAVLPVEDPLDLPQQPAPDAGPEESTS